MWIRMLSGDPVTLDSLKKLWGLAREESAGKPLVIWIGAGPSSWLGYERWGDLAERFHRSFAKSTSTYRGAEANAALIQCDYPTLFQLCFTADPHRYRRMLADSFSPRPLKAVYRRFLEAIERLEIASVVTTNVDEMLERSMSGLELVQRSDLERMNALIASKTRFVAKLHGSISSIESTVFKSSDYALLAADSCFIESVKGLLSACCVVFIGYSVRDEYVLDLLNQHSLAHPLFGGGPHFLISGEAAGHPIGVNIVRYRNDLHTDHRSSILAIELLSRSKAEASAFAHLSAGQGQPDVKSAHLLSDFCPAGTYTSNEIYGLAGDGGRKMQMVVGPDWSYEELARSFHSAHDLAMALVCFDNVLIPLESASRVFDLLGEIRFDALVSDGVLQFVHWEGHDSVIFQSEDAGFGSLATARVSEGSAGEVIGRRFKPAPGKDSEAKALIERIERKVTSIDLSGSLNFADICNGLFISPTTRAMLGIGEATPAGNIPRWVAHEALRIVQIARVGATCQNLALGSMKLMPGTAKFAESAFAAMASGVLASDPGSYVMSGEFGILNETAFRAQPSLWDSIICFRAGNVGTRFRHEILKRLMNNEGAEIVPSIDASLHQALPAGILNEARREMSALLLANGNRQVVPAIWSDSRMLQEGPLMWRRKSRERLISFLAKAGLGQYDPCPCGSFENVKFCCLAALDDR